MYITSLKKVDPYFSDNPILYHLITDRFVCTEGHRQVEFDARTEERSAAGEFHGGTLRGVMLKLSEGWFDALGVNAILISAPYQQILGWVPGGLNEFKHYAYHGYYALDYTTVDSRFGTDNDLTELVDMAHKRGIRVLLDIVMNHPGYPDMSTLNKLRIPVIREDWIEARPDQYYDCIDFGDPRFGEWWGKDWVRASIAGYDSGGADDLTATIWGLPDFKTESRKKVRPPAFFNHLPATGVQMDDERTVAEHLTNWLCSWVKKFGIDGFRCDSAKHVDLQVWSDLKSSAGQALSELNCKSTAYGTRPSNFWMVGEVFDHEVEYSTYFNHGFDALINFGFQRDLKGGRDLEEVYNGYSGLLCGRPGFNFLSYISSHDTSLFDRSEIYDAATKLMLAPGGVLIYYGDETGRAPGPFFHADPSQATRSNMNWTCVDSDLLEHWRRLCQFRARHIALARGVHRKIAFDSYAFGRIDTLTDDRVVAVFNARGWIELPVCGFFEDGEKVQDAYSGWSGQVAQGCIRLPAKGTVLIEVVLAT